MARDSVMWALLGICGISMVYVLITNSMTKRRKYGLTGMGLIGIMLLIFSKLAGMYNGSVITLEAKVAMISKFMVYALQLLIVLVFNVYVKDLFLHEGNENEVPKGLRYADFVIISGVVTLVLSRYFKFYYTFENNVYVRTRGYFISYVFPIVALVLQLAVIIRHRKKLRRLLVPLLAFTIAPISASIIQYFFHGTSLVISTIVSAVVLLYAFSILDTNELVKEALQREIEIHKREIEILTEKEENTKLFTEQVAFAMGRLIDIKDPYTKGHSKRVARYAVKIAQRAGKSREECDEIYFTALLHDVGKLVIPDQILKKNSKLTDSEFEVIKSHPKIGKEALEEITIAPNLSIGAAYHHERYDGKGYPFGLKGEEIPDIARLISVADVYDAMTSKRSYNSVLSQSAVRDELEEACGTQLDPVYAKIMLDLIDEDTSYRMRHD